MEVTKRTEIKVDRINDKQYMFRDLKESEIDCRQATFAEDYVTLLLYKDARVDMDILDETVGPKNWQRDHKELKGNIYCGISIFDKDKNEWIIKWDCGKESFSESEKGESSDSFKRAGFNWGIGRELYTAPNIFITQKDTKGENNFEIKERKGKKYISTKFYVEKIQIIDKIITGLAIKNDKGKRVFVWKKEEK